MKKQEIKKKPEVKKVKPKEKFNTYKISDFIGEKSSLIVAERMEVGNSFGGSEIIFFDGEEVVGVVPQHRFIITKLK